MARCLVSGEIELLLLFGLFEAGVIFARELSSAAKTMTKQRIYLNIDFETREIENDMGRTYLLSLRRLVHMKHKCSWIVYPFSESGS